MLLINTFLHIQIGTIIRYIMCYNCMRAACSVFRIHISFQCFLPVLNDREILVFGSAADIYMSLFLPECDILLSLIQQLLVLDFTFFAMIVSEVLNRHSIFIFCYQKFCNFAFLYSTKTKH